MAAKIPQVQTEDPKFNQYQQNVAKALQLVLTNPINYGQQLTGIALKQGQNEIPHKLDRKLQGWFIVRQRFVGVATDLIGIQDLQDTNKAPQNTLILYATDPISVDIFVY